MDKPMSQPTPLTVRQIAALMDINPKSTNRPITTVIGIIHATAAILERHTRRFT